MASDAPVLRCERCADPIGRGRPGGYWVDMVEVQAVEREAEEWDARHPDGGAWVGELLERPALAHWTLTHDECRPDDTSIYDLGMPDSHASWLAWTAHLMGKRWLSMTDFGVLLRRVATGDGADRAA